MKKRDLSYYFIVAIFLIAGFLSWNLYFKVYRQTDTVDISRFPKNINSWTSEEFPLTATEKAILETDNVFVRKYTSPNNDEVYLFIVYSQNNRKVSHPPEICYTGSGATILSSVADYVQAPDNEKIRSNLLTVEHKNLNQVVLYWFKVGDSFTSNYWKQQFLIALKSFFGQPASSALVRVSAVYNEEGQKAEAVRLTKEFSAMVVPHLSKYLP